MLTLMLTATFGRAESRQDVEYGQAGGVSLRMDTYLPDGPGPHPAAIIVHGGAWVRGDRKIDVQPLFKPLQNAGIAWFSISYRLANGSANGIGGIASSLLMGEGIDDVLQAIRHIRGHAAEYNIDPDRIVLIGESAGAQLASMAALKPEMAGKIKAVVAFYSPSDLASMAQNSNQIPESYRQALKGSPLAEMLMTGLKNLSPINFVREGMPPFLLIHGTSDTLVPFEQSEEMCKRIHDVGASCELYPVRGGGHGMRWWESSRHTAYKQHMIDWLSKQLTVAAASKA